MSQELWNQVDAYINGLLVGRDEALEGALERSREAGLPGINVAPNQGKLLHLLARIQGARRILEVGTLGGYSTIWLARAVPDDGQVVTLELDPQHAAVARANLEAAGLSAKVTVVEGRAIDSLETLRAEAADPFDLVFIDADKQSNADYVRASLGLTRPGSVIIVDNVVRSGAVVDAASEDAMVQGTRRLNDYLASEPRLSATEVQTVGSKGHDGFALALVLP